MKYGLNVLYWKGFKMERTIKAIEQAVLNTGLLNKWVVVCEWQAVGHV